LNQVNEVNRIARDINYLAATLVGEARGEPIEGIIAVANVIKNRCYASGKNYEEVCLSPKQFSCWNQDDKNFNYIRDFHRQLENGEEIKDPYLIQCIAVARCVHNNEFVDNTKFALNYVTTARYQLATSRKSPVDTWITKMKPTVTLGNHVFLREK
jgi:spore germination cell wall hydrolase CwlJ-like protein